MHRLRGKVVSSHGDFGFWIERLNHFYKAGCG
jgi:hypothetical protein